MTAAHGVLPQNRDRIPPPFRQTETLFVTRCREIPHAHPKLCSIPLAGPEAAGTQENFEVEAVAGVGVGAEMIVGIEGGTVISISVIDEMLPIGMTVAENVSVPIGATAIGTASEDGGPHPVDARHLEGIFETLETRVMALSV